LSAETGFLLSAETSFLLSAETSFLLSAKPGFLFSAKPGFLFSAKPGFLFSAKPSLFLRTKTSLFLFCAKPGFLFSTKSGLLLRTKTSLFLSAETSLFLRTKTGFLLPASPLVFGERLDLPFQLEDSKQRESFGIELVRCPELLQRFEEFTFPVSENPIRAGVWRRAAEHLSALTGVRLECSANGASASDMEPRGHISRLELDVVPLCAHPAQSRQKPGRIHIRRRETGLFEQILVRSGPGASGPQRIQQAGSDATSREEGLGGRLVSERGIQIDQISVLQEETRGLPA
ncbi:MAG: hypothetical protein WBV82_01515, partial [Myxococcaceae bacterium]